MRRSIQLLLASASVALVVVPAAHAGQAGQFTFSPDQPLPGSPPQGTARGGEPSLSFDPSGNGWVYITTPDRRAGSAPGVHLWRSSDHGLTWMDPQDVGAYSGGSDSDVLALDDHTLVVADLEVAATAICRSKDFGKTFGDGCDSGATYDQVGPVSDREWLNTIPGHPETLFDTYDGLGQGFTPQVQKSTDGGTTWSSCGELLEPGSDAASHYTVTGAAENSEVIGRPAIAPDGTMYVPFTLPNRQAEDASGDPTESSMFLAISPKGGCDPTSVWHDVTVWAKPGSNFISLFPNVVIDAAGTVYASGAGKLAGTDAHQGLYVWTSTDGGKTFGAPVRASSPDVGAVQLQSLAVGLGAGELLAGFYGATNVSDANDSKGEWRYYLAQSFDGGQTWTQATATPDVAHYGNICNKGIICTGDDNRNLLDFTTVGVDPANGCGYATFAVDRFNPPGATDLKDPAASVSRQTDGPCLIPGGGTKPTTTGGQSPLAPNVTACADRIGPTARIARRIRQRDDRLSATVRATDRGCLSGGRGTVRRVQVSIARVRGKRCQFLGPRGRLGHRRSCARRHWLNVPRRHHAWSFHTGALRNGRYRIWVRGIDANRNVGHPSRPRAVRVV